MSKHVNFEYNRFMRKIIGLDMDGVILDHAETKVLLAGQLGFRVKPEETPSEIMKDKMPIDVYHKMQNQLYDHPEVAFLSPLMSGAREFLEQLISLGTPYFLISRRRNPDVAVEILRRKGLWPRFFNEKNTFFVLEKEDKNIKAEELRVTHYVDDETGVLEKLPFVKYKFLFDKFGAFPDGENYKKVGSWEDLRAHLL